MKLGLLLLGFDALDQWGKEASNAKFGYSATTKRRISRIIEQAMPEINNGQKEQVELIQKYGGTEVKKGDKSYWQLEQTHENFPKFSEESQELLNEDVELSFNPVPLEKIESTDLDANSLNILIALGFVVDEEWPEIESKEQSDENTVKK